MRLNMHNVSFASIKRPVSFTGRFIVLVLRLAQMTVLSNKPDLSYKKGLLPNALLVLATAHHHVQHIVDGVFFVTVTGGVELVQDVLGLLARATCLLITQQGGVCVCQQNGLSGNDGP